MWEIVLERWNLSHASETDFTTLLVVDHDLNYRMTFRRLFDDGVDIWVCLDGLDIERATDVRFEVRPGWSVKVEVHCEHRLPDLRAAVKCLNHMPLAPQSRLKVRAEMMTLDRGQVKLPF